MSKRWIQATLASCFALAVVGAFGRTGAAAGPVDYANATYHIENEDIKLVRGERSVPVAPDSATQHVTRVLSQPRPVFGRLGSQPTASVFLLDAPGGSGNFYYVGVAFGDGRPARAVLLGDRIRPRSIAFHGERIVITYLDRKPNDPMVAEPTVRKRMTLRFDAASSRLIELKSDVPTHETGKSDD